MSDIAYLIIRLTRKIAKQISPDDFTVIYKTIDIEFMEGKSPFIATAEITPEDISEMTHNDIVSVEIIKERAHK